MAMGQDTRQLVEQHMNLVNGLAVQLHRGIAKGLELEDLVAYGTKGLIEAAERFDARHGATFSTFAYYRVKGAMMDGVRTMGWYSRADYARYRAEERVNQYLRVESDRTPESTFEAEDSEDLMAGLAHVLDAVASIHIVSIDAAATVSDDSLPSVEETLGEKQSDARVRAAVHSLPEKERQLMELYYFGGKTLEEAGLSIGLSKSWASRLHTRAVDLLRKELVRQDLVVG
jgi:RNA polymerase sigma factor FliA